MVYSVIRTLFLYLGIGSLLLVFFQFETNEKNKIKKYIRKCFAQQHPEKKNVRDHPVWYGTK